MIDFRKRAPTIESFTRQELTARGFRRRHEPKATTAGQPTYTFRQECWYRFKGWVLGEFHELCMNGHIRTISAGCGCLSGIASYFIGSWAGPSVLPIAVRDFDKQVLTGLVSALACTITAYKVTQHLTGYLWSKCVLAIVDHTSSLAKKSRYFMSFKKAHADALVKSFHRHFYVKEGIKIAVQRMKISQMQDLIIDYLDSIFQKKPSLNQLSPSEQLSAISSALTNDLGNYIKSDIKGDKTDQISSSLSQRLIEEAASQLYDNRSGKISATLEATKNVLDKSSDASSMYQNILIATPGSHPMGLINLIFNDIITPQIQTASIKKQIEQSELNHFVKQVLHKAVLDYLRSTIRQEEALQQSPSSNIQVSPVEDTALSLATGEPTAHKHRKAKATPAKNAASHKGKTSSSQLTAIEHDSNLPRVLVENSDCKERQRHLKKCAEKIQNFQHWKDVRLAIAAGVHWKATRDEDQPSCPIYHVSSGNKAKGGHYTATVLFTRKGNQIEPIAIARHTGRSSTEYQIIQPLGNWQIRQKTVNLKEELTVNLPTENP